MLWVLFIILGLVLLFFAFSFGYFIGMKVLAKFSAMAIIHALEYDIPGENIVRGLLKSFRAILNEFSFFKVLTRFFYPFEFLEKEEE